MQALAVRPTGVRVAAIRAQCVLGSHDPAIAIRADQLADDALALPACIEVGGIDEVSTGVGEAADDCLRLLPSCAPASPLVAEDHRSEAELGNPHARATEQPVAHHENSSAAAATISSCGTSRRC